MSTLDRINQELIKALKARDSEKLTTLRGLKSDLQYRRIEKGDDLTEEEITAVLSSARKRHSESIEQFKAGGREDLVKKEQAGLEIIEQYLPEQISENDLRKHIAVAISAIGADSPKSLGLVMKELMPKIKGRADGKLAKNLAMEMLAKQN